MEENQTPKKRTGGRKPGVRSISRVETDRRTRLVWELRSEGLKVKTIAAVLLQKHGIDITPSDVSRYLRRARRLFKQTQPVDEIIAEVLAHYSDIHEKYSMEYQRALDRTVKVQNEKGEVTEVFQKGDPYVRLGALNGRLNVLREMKRLLGLDTVNVALHGLQPVTEVKVTIVNKQESGNGTGHSRNEDS